MPEDVVLYEVKDDVAKITLNRPERLNAWTGEMEAAYFDYLEAAAGDLGVRVIVVTGAGRGFCAGADMEVLQTVASRGQAGRRARPSVFPLSIPKPIVAAINGPCAGIGFVHALMSDIRFGAAGAKLTSSFSRRGLIAEHGVSWLLPRLAGQAVALDVLLSGRVFLAEEALAMGILNRVLPPESLMEETMAYAADMAANCSPASLSVIKRQVYRHVDLGLEEALAESNRLMADSLRSPEFEEGIASFVEKRLPRFQALSARPEPTV